MMNLLLGLWLLLAPPALAAGPSWVTAPEPIWERPEVAAPLGGWWTIDGQYAAVHSDLDDRATARRLADHAAKRIPELGEVLGVPTGATIDIYVSPTREAFSEDQPGRVPEWADGTAWASLGLIFLHAPDARDGAQKSLEQVLDHEIVHVLLGRAFHPKPVPHWLQEGLAQFYAGELGADTAAQLTAAGGTQSILPLARITRGFPRDPVAARLAYAQSADFVGWLHGTYGPDTLRTLIRTIAQGQRFEDALAQATGGEPGQIEQQWRARWDSPWIRLSRWANPELLFALGSAAILVGGYRRWRRGKEKLARWEEEERARAAALFHVERVHPYTVDDDAVLRRELPGPPRPPGETWH